MKINSHMSLPSAAVLEMTYRCNHQCIFCCCPWEAPDTVYPKVAELTISEWIDVVDCLCSRGVQSLVLSGGEPLVKNDLKELILHIASKRSLDGKTRIRPYIISNGALLNDKWLELFAETQATLALSVPGIKTYEYHTKFDRVSHVLKWIARSSSAGIYTVANVTATRKNLFELYENVGLSLLHGANFVLLNRFLPGGRGLSYSDELLLSKEETLRAFRTVDAALNDGKRWGGVGTEVPMCALSNTNFKRLSISTKCAAGNELFVIDPSGRIRVCNHSPVVLEKWTEIDKIDNNPYWRLFAEKNFLPEYCLRCSQKSVCDAGCREAAHILCGSPDSPDWIMESHDLVPIE